MFDYSKKANPIIKCAGGKTSILSTLLCYFPSDFKRYIEPFAGGLAPFLSLDQEVDSIISDLNSEFVNLYRIVKSEYCSSLLKQLDILKESYSEKFYYELRSNVPECLIKQAARTIFLNKTCFNGLYRQNKKGEFNVPFGKRVKCPTLYDEENFELVAERLKRTKILNEDFEEVIDLAEEGDFVYCDPPYAPISSTSNFNQYLANGFSSLDQIRLKDACNRASERGAKVIVSNSNNPHIKEIYKDWDIRQIKARRNINAVGSKRGPIPELVILKLND